MTTEPIWYVAHTGAGKEKKALHDLNRMGYHTFFPFDRVRRRRKKGHTYVVEWTERPHFNRYIFVRLDGPRQSIEGIESADGVSVVLRGAISHEPIRVPYDRMELIMDRAMVRFGDEKQWIAALMRELIVDTDKQVTLYVSPLGRRSIDVSTKAA